MVILIRIIAIVGVVVGICIIINALSNFAGIISVGGATIGLAVLGVSISSDDMGLVDCAEGIVKLLQQEN